MNIDLKNLGRRYHFEWVFRNITLSLSSSKIFAVTGKNGAGKSTFLQVVSGVLSPSEGSVDYVFNHQKIEVDSVYPFLAWCAPGLDLIGDFTAKEMLDWHFRVKPAIDGITSSDMLEQMGLSAAANKSLHQLSSGMRQRIKLATVLFCDVPMWLLDEPCTNLDDTGIQWYRQTVQKNGANRLVLIASNDPQEYNFADETIDLMPYLGSGKK
jgi:ABC-type multidrug transport system ATPase subunit